ncbi:class I SAM-dependent RNA methyltransferase [Methylocystis heyeri]|uniref:Methyltransferase n=1 Tax=Methylocystis heyeri TaxID=391905 RepID=A0A6B8KJQ7_9HYPH|nr:TRAM domain-containing protein [Methylocystis heyeri]QGM46838.1 methyltransferase [Methylocystis heyeri]
MTKETVELFIERLGHRGEGVARLGERLVFVPFALAGEKIRAEVEGEQGRLLEILEPSPHRIEASCPYYGVCGGCAVQALSNAAYAQWKRGLVETALRNAGVAAQVAPLVDAHGSGRRRATFHARGARVGFMQARSHEIVEIESCPLLEAGLEPALAAAKSIAKSLAAKNKPLDIAATLTLEGLDIDIRGCGELSESETTSLAGVAERHDLARLANHGRIVALRRKPYIAVGKAQVSPPSGSFLQATEAGEEELARLVAAAAQDSKCVADLFCGVGAFALRLAAQRRVFAYDNDAGAVAALLEAARAVQGLRLADAYARDLFRKPLQAGELASFDAVVFDPPRAGAQAQAQQLAKSGVARIVAVSCNPQSFARDAKTLVSGGYALSEVIPVDQFRFSSHVELVAAFSRELRAPRKRALLSR